MTTDIQSYVTIAASHVPDGNMQFGLYEDSGAVIGHRQRFLGKYGMDIDSSVLCRSTYDRTNYREYAVVSDADRGVGMYDKEAAAPHDAIFTQSKDVSLFLPLADCQAGVLYDPVHTVLALAHLGRHSVEQYGAREVVAFMRDMFGSNPEDIMVWLGPAPGNDSYPLWQRDNMSLREANLRDLQDAGIELAHISHNYDDTVRDFSYFSHSEYKQGRRENDGRHAVACRIV